jgi:D-lactate dehydratase
VLIKRSCHGPCLFPGVIDHETGKSICAGKTITGFTTEGEDVMGLMEIVRSWGKPLVEDHAAALGAKCTE